MSVASRARRASTVFAIPENAHTDLVMLRDHVHLMVELIAAAPDDSQSDTHRCSDVVSRHLSRVAKQIDEHRRRDFVFRPVVERVRRRA